MAKSQREYFLKEQLKSIKKVHLNFKPIVFHNLLFSFYSMKYYDILLERNLALRKMIKLI